MWDLDGYRGDLNGRCVTIAEALGDSGYSTYMSGKWHVTRHIAADGPKHSWPRQRGFDHYYGIITGAADYFAPKTLTRGNDPAEIGDDYYITDAISDQAAEYITEHAANDPDTPFFTYVAYTAPHWPLHALPEDMEKYVGRFDAGWDRLREERLERMVEMGIIDRQWQLTDRDPTQPPWEDAPDKEWQARRMEVYAAQIDRMDQGIGRIIDSLEETGQLDNTLIIFLADNGGCAEEIESHWFGNADRNPIIQMRTRDGKLVQIGNEPDHMPGHQDTYQSYGIPWANLSNTPFRLYKHWVHEGGIATPLIAHWPEGVAARGELRHQPAQLPDIMATFLDVTGAEYPAERGGNAIHPLEGYSLMPIMHDDGPNEREALYFEHEGNCALKQGKWKLVKRFPGDWELYDMDADRTEMRDLACAHPEKVTKRAATWQAWAEPRGIEPWDQANPGLRNA
ncbi:MAG TPA: sulfatase-like hydrolase/transferase [Armatimonadota bacterium]|nr:sulfatase-like hydrolase/transferase [Armatimonadota bacterium]